MKRLIPGLIVLTLLAGPVSAQDISALLTQVAQNQGSLAGLRAEIQPEAGGDPATLLGTAVCIDKSGLMLTLSFDPRIRPETITQLELILPGAEGETLPAKLLGIDPLTGLSFLQASGNNDWQVVKFQRTSDLKLGDPVVSMGLMLTDPALSPMLGAGFVGNIRRTPAWQIGVTGGQLSMMGSVVFNTQGRAIGLVGQQPYMRYQTVSRRGTMNMPLRSEDLTTAFMPVEEFIYVFNSIPNDGTVRRLPWIGVGRFSPVPDALAEAKGLTQPAVMIDQVIPGHAADKAGLKNRDIILGIDGSGVEQLATPDLTAANFRRNLLRKSAGQEISLDVLSGGQSRTVQLKLTPMPKLPNEAPRVFHRQLGMMLREKVMLDKFLDDSASAGADGMLVMGVGQNTPAGRAGLKQGDVVVMINGKPVQTAQQAAEIIDGALKNNPPLDLRLLVQRGENKDNIVIRTAGLGQ